MRYFAGCLFSAVLGGLFVQWVSEPRLRHAALAEETQPLFRDENVRGPRLPAPPPAIDGGGLAASFNRDGVSLDEAVGVAVYERCNKSVGNIVTKTSEGFFLMDVTSEGSGSGLVLDRAGHILTNYHVIEDAKQVGVTLFDGKTYDATPVGVDPINDLAVIRIDAPRDVLYPVTIGESSRLKVGMRVFAIGNPFGLERTMTTGIISSLNRTLQVRSNRTIKSIIQIDAAVNPGNSGGPLLDSHGRLIGINTAIASNTGQSAGVGFAIPANLIARVVPQLVKHGRVIRPEVGIQQVYETEKGLLVARLTPNGPAARAGLRGPQVKKRAGLFALERMDRNSADLIVEVDGQPVKTADDFLSYIEAGRPGEKLVVTIVRDGRRIKVPVALGGE